MTFKFHPEALLEYEAAARHYASIQTGLEQQFIQQIEATISQILEFPQRWRIFESDIRFCSVRIFPYRILYSIEKDFVLIIAITHLRRQPGYWQQRIN